ncbi:MAG: glycoside hydrolase family 3 protein, partial [Aminobacteriaceae bacterium]
SNMSLEEKVGQIMMCFFEGSSLSPHLERVITEMKAGGVILYSSRGNIRTTEQVAELVEKIQKKAAMANSWPLFIAVDQEGGLVNRINEGTTLFPGNMALGASGDERLAARVAGIMAEELSAMGINVNFAPVVDVNNDPHNPIIGVRSFGSSPELVSRLGRAMISGFLEKGVLPCAKHFPGHGNTGIDSHTGLPVISSSMQDLNATELPPFRAAIEAGVPMIMTAHVLVPALDLERPGTLSPNILGMLRNEMGFSGIIVTDSMGMGALEKGWGMIRAAIEAFNAGADILLFGADRGHLEDEHPMVFKAILEACRSGVISETRLDESVERILKAKARLGLSLHKRPSGTTAPRKSARKELTAAEAASKSITLVRNWSKATAQLRSGKKTLLIWPGEKIAAGKQLASLCSNFSVVSVPEKPRKEDIQAVLEKAGSASVIFAGEYDSWKNPDWMKLLKTLGESRLFLLSARSPYALSSLPSTGGSLVLYSDIPSVITSAAAILNGTTLPLGKLPVDLPGIHSAGWGLEKID